MTADRLHGEGAFTLVEVIATVVVLGTAFAVFVGGLGTSIVASDYHRKQATAEALLRDFAEAVKSQSYVACATATTNTYNHPANYSPDTSFPASITSVKYWSNGAYSATQPAGCPSSDNGLQLLSLRVAATTGRATESVDIIKRQP